MSTLNPITTAEETTTPINDEAETELTLDTIEDLTLPGDMDQTEEQQGQRFRITDDGCADWALKKIKA